MGEGVSQRCAPRDEGWHQAHKTKIRLILWMAPLVFGLLACRTVIGAWETSLPPTWTPAASPLVLRLSLPTRTPTAPATATPLTATPTLQPSPTPTASTTPLPSTLTLTPTPSHTSPLLSSSLQLTVFEELWQVVNENYLYPDFNGLNWDAVHVEYRQRIEAGLSEEDFYLAMSEMINRLGDEHSVFLSPEEAAQADADIEGDYSYVGIGITTAAIPERNLLTIVLVFPGSAAEEAGLQMHDNILAVDGQPIIDESGVRRDLLRGPVGTSVVLTVQTPNQEPRQVPVIRRQVTGELPVPYQALTSPQGRRIGYIMIPTFFDNNVDDQVRDALLEMGEVGPLDGLILDNRMNAGGLSNVFIDTLALFSEGMLGYFDVRGSDAALDVEANDIFGSQSLPLVVLVDSGTVSFGEIFAGILQDTRRAHLIGERTDGNVEILLAYSFSDGSRAWIANQTFRPLNHPEQDWEQTGIVPDQTVVTNWDQETMDTDPAIQAALEHLDAAQSPGLAEIPGALRLSTAWFIASSAPLW